MGHYYLGMTVKIIGIIVCVRASSAKEREREREREREKERGRAREGGSNLLLFLGAFFRANLLVQGQVVFVGFKLRK